MLGRSCLFHVHGADDCAPSRCRRNAAAEHQSGALKMIESHSDMTDSATSYILLVHPTCGQRIHLLPVVVATSVCESIADLLTGSLL